MSIIRKGYVGLALLLIVAVLASACGATPTPAPTEKPAEPAATEEPVAEEAAPTEEPMSEEAAEEEAPAESEVVEEAAEEAEETGGQEAEGGIRKLRVTFSWPTFIDPAVGSDFSSSTALANLYDTLVFPNADGGIDAWLADSWEASEDGMTWTFKLKDGVKFHDGSDLTASDVAYSMNRLLEIGEGYAYLFVDRSKVQRLSMTRPWSSNFLRQMVSSCPACHASTCSMRIWSRKTPMLRVPTGTTATTAKISC